jgi:hypothetical protein
MSLVLPIYANLLQFSDIIKYKTPNPQFYIIKYLEYDAICAIVQDWINPTNMIAFYAIHSKLTNIIRIYYKHCSDRHKSEERAKFVINLPLEPITQELNILHREKKQLKTVKIFNNKSYIYLKPVPRCNIDWEKINNIIGQRIKIPSWKIRRYVAVFSVALVNFLKKNKIITNKAGRVFFNRRLNRHIASYF